MNKVINNNVSLKTFIAVRIIIGLVISLVTIGLYHQWAQRQPIARERLKIATCDRSLLIHQEAVRLAKLHLPEEERRKAMIQYIIKYRKIIDAHPELIFDPQPQGRKIADLTAQIKREIESITWK